MQGIDTRWIGEHEEYWVVFTQGTHFISRLLRPNFSHVYLFTRDKYNWIALNPTRSRLVVDILPVKVDEDAPRLLAHPNDMIVKITFAARATRQQFGYVGLLNCLTFAKYMLGINCFALTPWRFYRRLINFSPRERAFYGIQSIRQV